MRETAVIIGSAGQALHWHAPANRTSVTLPDSRYLWDVIWGHRDNILGIAHTHPGSGTPGPSLEDLTTFAAIEAGLGRRLQWWIATSDQVGVFIWTGPDRYEYKGFIDPTQHTWLPELRTLSAYGVPHG